MVHLHGLAGSSAGTVGWVPPFCCMFSCLQLLITRWLGSKKEEKEAVSFLKNWNWHCIIFPIVSWSEEGPRFRPGSGLGNGTTLPVEEMDQEFAAVHNLPQLL